MRQRGFPSLTSFSVAAFESLSKHQGGYLGFGQANLSDANVDLLSKRNGHLGLSCLTSLSDEAAASLSKHEGALYLYGLTNLSDTAAATTAPIPRRQEGLPDVVQRSGVSGETH